MILQRKSDIISPFWRSTQPDGSTTVFSLLKWILFVYSSYRLEVVGVQFIQPDANQDNYEVSINDDSVKIKVFYS